MTKATTRWRTDEYKNSLDRLNQAVNEYREDSVRVSVVLVENGVYNPYEAMGKLKWAHSCSVLKVELLPRYL